MTSTSPAASASSAAENLRTPGARAAARAACSSPAARKLSAAEEALVAGEVDLVVYRTSEVPPELPSGVVLAAYLRRNTPFDVLVTLDAETLDELPRGSRVFARSLRRRGQLANYRSDVEWVEARGTLRQWRRDLDAGTCRALVVAADTVESLGLQELVGEILSPGVCLPAPGQGGLGLAARHEAKEVLRLLRSANDKGTEAEVTAELAVLRGLGLESAGSVGALAHVSGSSLSVDGVVVGSDDGDMARYQVEGDLAAAAELGAQLAERLLDLGADEFLRAPRRRAGRGRGVPGSGGAGGGGSV